MSRTISFFCGNCNNVFAIPSRPGQLPKLCNKCRDLHEIEKMTEKTASCRKCNNSFVVPKRSGRPASLCEKCRELQVLELQTPKATTISVAPKAPQVQEKPEFDKMMACLCEQCHDVFAIPSRRGRPPKYCNRCLRGGDLPTQDESQRAADRYRAKLRVDNLEMLLKSRGTHISQHQFT